MTPTRRIMMLLVLGLASLSEATLAAPPKTLWEGWYRVELPDGKVAQYYQDRVTRHDGKIQFENNVWKEEEGFINEESIGTFSEDKPGLKPLFFNLRSTYRSYTLTIDGTRQPDGAMVFKIRKGDKELPPLKRVPPSNAILSTSFPVWLGQNLASLKVGESRPFLSIQEDDFETGYLPVSGRITLEKPDAFATKNNVSRVSVTYRDVTSTWWVDKLGKALKIEMPKQGLVVRLVSETEAKKSFQTTQKPSE